MAGMNVGGSETISGITRQQGEFKGHGIGARAQAQAHGGNRPRPNAPVLVPVIPDEPPLMQPVQVPWWLNIYNNHGTESINGNINQVGTFKGHGTGASIQGGFTASGDIK